MSWITFERHEKTTVGSVDLPEERGEERRGEEEEGGDEKERKQEGDENGDG
jgi:hypothetical protein